MSTQEVIAGTRRWFVEQGDCLSWLRSLPADSVDLICCSPPYEKARLYLEGGEDLGIARGTEEWVAWLVEVVRECVRVCRGLVALVVEGQTEDYRYSCGPALLAADLHRAGFNLRRPLIYRRSGIPGSGGKDWLRCDHEWVVCVTRPGRLPWSDPTACGHPPKWAPGGEMSHRMSDGKRVNAHGVRRDGVRIGGRRPAGKPAAVEAGQEHSLSDKAVVAEDGPSMFGAEPPSEPDPFGKRGRGNNLGGRKKDGAKKKGTRAATFRRSAGQMEDQQYTPPVLANPGTVHDTLYTADEVRSLLAACGVADDRAEAVIDCGAAGGGRLGSMLAHDNEAPYSERLCEFLIRSFCQPGGLAADPFSGSGTTGAVSVRCGRRFLGCDLRASQVALAVRRIECETPPIPGLESTP